MLACSWSSASRRLVGWFIGAHVALYAIMGHRAWR